MLIVQILAAFVSPDTLTSTPRVKARAFFYPCVLIKTSQVQTHFEIYFAFACPVGNVERVTRD